MRSLRLLAGLGGLAALVMVSSSCASSPGATPASAVPTTHASIGAPASALRAMRIADLPLPGSPAFVAVARDVVDLAVTIDPSVAANAGLFEDAARVPSYTPERVKELVARADRDLAALRALPWRTFSVDQQVDWRWLYANVETSRRQLADERLYVRRPAQWLEPLANTLIDYVSYVPERADLQRRVLAQVPAMLGEVRAVANAPTKRDLETASQLVVALTAMAKATASPEGAAAAAALDQYGAYVKTLAPPKEFEVIGPDAYAWRFRHAALLPWTPDQLLQEAESALAAVDAEIASIEPRLPHAKEASEAQKAQAHALTRESLLGMYDTIETSLRAATERGAWVTVPAWVGPIHARETPDAMVPLTGDGGSMSPPPTYVTSDLGFWNVEHFQATWTEKERIETVTSAQGWATNGMGPYAAHEGFPGHHLQLAIARRNDDPLRSVLPDSVLMEGWALYAEEALWAHGGFGDASPLETRRNVLRSLRHRIARVVYDVNVERGAWDLQRAADFKSRAAAGKGKIDEDLLRSIQWPTQLVHYWSGKLEIVRLRDELKKRQGAQFDERAFHDALLAEGSVPVALVRAKMLGEPIPAPE
jgi:hypothetical protein